MMTVNELIRELQKQPGNAEVILPGGNFGTNAFGITEVVECEPARMGHGSE